MLIEQKNRILAKITADIRDTGVKKNLTVGEGRRGTAGARLRMVGVGGMDVYRGQGRSHCNKILVEKLGLLLVAGCLYRQVSITEERNFLAIHGKIPFTTFQPWGNSTGPCLMQEQIALAHFQD